MKTFIETTDELQKYIEGKTQATSLCWTFFEDYAWKNNTLYISRGDIKNNENLVRTLHESEEARVYGVEYRVVSLVDSVAYCSIRVPRNQREAEESMIVGIKMTIPERFPQTKIVDSTLKWMWVQRGQTDPSFVWDITKRKDCKN